VVEIYPAVIDEVVRPGTGMEFPGPGIARHAGDHIDEPDHTFGIPEDTAHTFEWVPAASAHLQSRIKGLTETCGIGPGEGVGRSEPALLSVELANKDLATPLEIQVVALQLLALVSLDEAAPAAPEVPGQGQRIVRPWEASVGRRAVTGHEDTLPVCARQCGTPTCLGSVCEGGTLSSLVSVRQGSTPTCQHHRREGDRNENRRAAG